MRFKQYINEGFNDELYSICEVLDDTFDGKLDIHMLNNKIQIRRGGKFILSEEYMPPELINKLIDENGELRWAFQRVDSDFVVETSKLKSIKGFPEYVGGDIDISQTGINTLHDIHKYIKTVNTNGVSQFICSWTGIKNSILGLILIDGLLGIKSGGIAKWKAPSPWSIVNRHIHQTYDNQVTRNQAVFDAQKELMDNGLSAYAKL